MRKEFTALLHEQMQKNKDIHFITGDLGFGLFDKIRDDFPDRFLNTGAAEQAMMDIAVGLALEGKIPFVYSITPFLIYRPYEAIRLYIDHEKIPVHLIGGGRDKDYHIDGFSHDATGVKGILDHFRNIKQYWPADETNLRGFLDEMITGGNPTFISLGRF
ncbi:MAG: transketolase family protein [Nitrosotalea sp.]